MAIAEVQLINRLLDDKDYKGIISDNSVTANDFTVCKDEFNFITDFYNKYHAVPDKETFISKYPNFELFKVSEPTKAIVDSVFEQSLFQSAVKVINSASKLFEVDWVRAAHS